MLRRQFQRQIFQSARKFRENFNYPAMFLYAWGGNSHGQLGLGFKSSREFTPRKVDLSYTDLKAENIVAIAGGSMHTLFLDCLGAVYCCGYNFKGQLGIRGDGHQLLIIRIDILSDFKIVEIACGWDYSAAISDCGNLYFWGNNEEKQLGLSRGINYTSIPTRLKVSSSSSNEFKHVSCGFRHSAMITEKGEVLVAGVDSHLTLGHNYNERFSYNSHTISKVPDIVGVDCVSTGQCHTVMLKGDVVHSWGENKDGELGIDCSILCNIPVPIRVFKHEGLAKVYAGWRHSAALTKQGEIFTWGRNNHGQLGSTRARPYKPYRIPGLNDIAHLSLGLGHNLAVSRDGRLYSWGWNTLGSCGETFSNDVMQPTRVLANHKVKLAFACYASSFAIVE